MKLRNAKLKVLELDPEKAYLVTVPSEFTQQDYEVLTKIFNNKGWPKVVLSKIDLEVQEIKNDATKK